MRVRDLWDGGWLGGVRLVPIWQVQHGDRHGIGVHMLRLSGRGLLRHHWHVGQRRMHPVCSWLVFPGRGCHS